MTWFEWLSLLFASTLVFWQCDTRNPYYLSLVVFGCTAILKWLSPNVRYLKCFKYFAVLAPILCGLLIFFQGIFIDAHRTEWLRELNMILTTRLQLNYDAVHEYGLTFWGKPVAWQASQIWNEYYRYNWVDSVYLYSLISYGVPFLIGFWGISVKLAFDADKKKDIYMLLVLTVVAILGLIDNYCFRVECNPFFMFLAYGVYQPEKAVNHPCLDIGGFHEIY